MFCLSHLALNCYGESILFLPLYKIMLRPNQALRRKKIDALILFSASQNGNGIGYITINFCLSSTKVHELFYDYEHGSLLKVASCLLYLHLMQLKRWERKKCKPNSLPILHKMHVKVGDTVKIISGREKGKTGEISKVFKHNSTVVVTEINLKTKHVKSRGEDEPGQIIKVVFSLLYYSIYTFSI